MCGVRPPAPSCLGGREQGSRSPPAPRGNTGRRTTTKERKKRKPRRETRKATGPLLVHMCYWLFCFFVSSPNRAFGRCSPPSSGLFWINSVGVPDCPPLCFLSPALHAGACLLFLVCCVVSPRFPGLCLHCLSPSLSPSLPHSSSESALSVGIRFVRLFFLSNFGGTNTTLLWDCCIVSSHTL